MTQTLTPLQTAAALAEIVYRRAAADQALDLADIQGASDFPVTQVPQILTHPDNYGTKESKESGTDHFSIASRAKLM